MLKKSIREFNNVYFKTEWKEENPFFNQGLTISLAVATGTLVDISYIWFITRDEDSMHSVWQHPKLSAFFPASTVHISYMCNIVKYWQDRMGSLEQYCMNTAIQSLLDWFLRRGVLPVWGNETTEQKRQLEIIARTCRHFHHSATPKSDKCVGWYVVTFENSDTDSLPEHSVQLITSA